MDPRRIGQKIKQLRKQRNLTQMELAERINVSFQQVQKYENGETQITLQRLWAISNALYVPITAFWQDFPQKISEEAGSYSAQEQIVFWLNKEEASFINLYRKIRSKKVKDGIMKLLKGIIELE